MSAARNILITGCSGGGKSTLIATLSALGFPVVEESGRRVIAQQKSTGGTAFPWSDMRAFLREVEAMTIADIADTHQKNSAVFFDRGLVDVLAAYELHLEDYSAAKRIRAACQAAYESQVFVAPPWPQIYERDDVRQHDFAAAKREYAHTLALLPKLGFKPAILPLSTPEERAQFVLRAINAGHIP